MADELYIDLDAFLEEQSKKKPPRVKAMGQEWILPQSPPADAMLRAQRFLTHAIDAQERLKGLGPDDDVPEDLKDIVGFDFESHARALIGSDNLDAMVGMGLPHDGLRHLVQQVMKIHQGGGSPNRAARRKGGRSPSKTS